MIVDHRSRYQPPAQSQYAILDAVFEAAALIRAQRLEYVNAALLKLLGMTRAEQLLEQSPLDFMPSDARLRALAQHRLHRMQQQGDKRSRIATTLIRLDGRPVPVELTGIAQTDADGPLIIVFIRECAVPESRPRQQDGDAAHAEANALARLNVASARLWQLRDLKEGLQEVLAAAIELLGADQGNVQLLDPERHVLTIAAQRGFDQDFLDFFQEVSVADDTACGRALHSGQRKVIVDVETDLLYAPYRPIARAAGYRAVQSTPLIGRGGKPLGMLSTHFRTPHRPSDADLRRLDLYARHARPPTSSNAAEPMKNCANGRRNWSNCWMRCRPRSSSPAIRSATPSLAIDLPISFTRRYPGRMSRRRPCPATAGSSRRTGGS